ncbi:Eco57I restriction-modification methylase domain-containing protein [Kribbella sp. VKM Ac-2568]|uniref:Eco57I restriction-modification methylase domain-containing protein n=1 Tax=Kribbella sp. VKM Ac-2568 TaxID=2512219 RepID=UPI00104A654E|nr:Eco57I restriction-modification methylase domain-containing protein [Kribbella sp. VKM Ac-2568]
MSRGEAAVVEQNYGEVFTRRWVVDALLDLTEYKVERDLGGLTLVDPSAGTGAFLLAAVERLLDSAAAHGRGWETLGPAIRAWELQARNATECRQALRSVLVNRGVTPATAADLAEAWVVEGDFLLPDDDLISVGSGTVEADVVVGNPPYIRLEDVPPALAADYRRRWPTMGGRADIYVGFIERSLSILRPEGRVGFICADRWMRNQYGAGLRRLVSGRYSVDAAWVMHDVDAFEAQVSAYPAITVLRRGEQRAVIAADTTADFNPGSATELVKWSQHDNTAEFASTGVAAYRLPHWFPGEESWPTGSPGRLRLIEHLNDHFHPLHDASTGTKVSIGVATGADKVFVTTETDAVEPDRLLPLSMVRDLASGEFQWSGHYLVDPWAPDGKLVELERYPRLKTYLETSGAGIKDRHVAKRSPHAWYRTIDKVDHSLTKRPKLLIQDMRASIHPVLEPGGHYPHHNVYYVVSAKWEMEVLGGLLLSRIAQAFIEAYCVRMRGGTLRFQSQYLKRIRVPSPDSISGDTADALRTAFQRRDVDAATIAAAAAYQIDLQDFDLD